MVAEKWTEMQKPNISIIKSLNPEIKVTVRYGWWLVSDDSSKNEGWPSIISIALAVLRNGPTEKLNPKVQVHLTCM